MKDKSMISVILPSYNSSSYLDTAIQSILNQTYNNFELLIIDDGSTDDTEGIVRTFLDRRIRYIKKEHTGLADTLNQGINEAKFELIARMDADDISHQERFEKQIKHLNQNPKIDWISCSYAVFVEDKIKYLYKLPEYSLEIKNNLILTSSICFAGSIFKKNCIIENGGFNGEAFEDYNLLLKIKDRCNFYNIQEVLYYQRKRKNSLSNNNFEITKQIIYDIQKPYYLNLKSNFNINNLNDENNYKGWREFLFGSKVKARYFWRKLNFKVFFYPKVLIGILVSFSPNIVFIYLKKVGFKIMTFYYPFISLKIKKEFKTINNSIWENLNDI